MPGRHVPIFSAPTPAEEAALLLAAAYLNRAGNEAASRLLISHERADARLELVAMLRDEMRDSAALCESLIALFDGWPRTDHTLAHPASSLF